MAARESRETPAHTPVLFGEVMELLRPRPGGRYIDCTLDGGGHAAGLLERSSPDGRLLGMDADPALLDQARQHLSVFDDRVDLVHANFRALGELAPARGFLGVQGVLFDLGLSSETLERSGRGFSFQRPDEPLDMRFDPTRGASAADLLNGAPPDELERLFRDFGEEFRAARLVRAVVERRRQQPFRTVADALDVVQRALGPRRGRAHPATRAFQALRIAVNDELDALEEGLRAGLSLLAPAGRVAVIAFHSLEDRIVKRMLQQHAHEDASPGVAVVTRKPIVPAREEVLRNPRSRSAKLRVAERR